MDVTVRVIRGQEGSEGKDFEVTYSDGYVWRLATSWLGDGSLREMARILKKAIALDLIKHPRMLTTKTTIEASPRVVI